MYLRVLVLFPLMQVAGRGRKITRLALRQLLQELIPCQDIDEIDMRESKMY